jgi:hypothetical protein
MDSIQVSALVVTQSCASGEITNEYNFSFRVTPFLTQSFEIITLNDRRFVVQNFRALLFHKLRLLCNTWNEYTILNLPHKILTEMAISIE